ncbi:gamma-glutamylcyclotransferase family protein [Streptomyces cyaneus]|uniref:gamma-glutamylcyclotransferase family protein n=1 Tax=Streptomyces cyaneus TaxID=1904 RepID=UPI000FF8AAFF|nr:gamma-glutamylcyclotransferase family protein [Streptomyces cyaneus]
MTLSPRLPFFVYGTLRPGEPNHDHFLRGRTHTEEPARLVGAALYDGPGYPYAVEERDGSGTVHGDLVTPRPEEYPTLLAALDRLEEYAPDDPRNLYERIARQVIRDSDATAVQAWVYVAAPPVAARLRTHGKLIESGDWATRPS